MAAGGSACCHHNFAAIVGEIVTAGFRYHNRITNPPGQFAINRDSPINGKRHAWLQNCGIADQFSGYGRLLRDYWSRLFFSVGIKSTKIFEQVGIAKNIIKSLTACGLAGLWYGRAFSLNILLK